MALPAIATNANTGQVTFLKATLRARAITRDLRADLVVGDDSAGFSPQCRWAPQRFIAMEVCRRSEGRAGRR